MLKVDDYWSFNLASVSNFALTGSLKPNFSCLNVISFDNFLNLLLFSQWWWLYFMLICVVFVNYDLFYLFSGTAIVNSTTKRYWYSTKKPNILSVTFVTRSYTRVRGCRSIVCRCIKRRLTRFPTRFRPVETSKSRSMAWKASRIRTWKITKDRKEVIPFKIYRNLTIVMN